MHPVSKTKAWTSKDDLEEPPTKMQALELPEGESDDEYEMVPKKARKGSSEPSSAAIAAPTAAAPVPTVPVTVVPQVVEVIAEDIPSLDAAETSQPLNGVDATDDDWLRSRTSRLLDLVKPTHAPVANVGGVPAVTDSTVQDGVPPSTVDVEMVDVDTTAENKATAKEVTESTDATTMEAIRQSGRLFVRNLPYTATEEDLRAHFEKYGALEEVCDFAFFFSFVLRFHDEYPDRDSLCFRASDVNWSEILVDAPCFLKSLYFISPLIYRNKHSSG